MPEPSAQNVLSSSSPDRIQPADAARAQYEPATNTASASVLVALDEAISNATIHPGDLVVTFAFGGGLSWGANLIRI